jgi:iron only hydrogenase large subunit-like protein
MKEVISVKEDACNKCFKCVSICPVKTCINATGDSVTIDHDKCIGCGACLTVCQTGAREIQDDFESFIQTHKKERVVAIVAPSIVTMFKDDSESYLKFNSFLKEQFNVKAVFDVSFGAELSTRGYINYIENNPDKKTVITQPCPSLVNYIEKYKPELLTHLAPVDSPMLCTIKYIKEFYTKYKNYKILVVSPCIAKRLEFNDTFPDVYNATFKSFESFIKKEGIVIDKYKPLVYDGDQAERAVLFSSPGGLKETVARTNPELNVRKVEGVHTVYNYLDNLKKDIDQGIAPQIVDCLNCEKGCNGGTGTNNVDKSIDEIESLVNKRKNKLVDKKSIKKIKKVVDLYWSDSLYKRYYTNKYKPLPKPNKTELTKIYESMHKYSEEDLYNCASCGYNYCEKMALAIHNNLNEAHNCHHYQLAELDIKEKEKTQLSLKIKKSIGESSELTNKVQVKMENMESSISQQVSAIEESSAAVEQILTNIRSIGTTTEGRKETLRRMGRDFFDVKKNLNDLVQVIDTIDTSVHDVDVMNKLVSAIAINTNLLSMNAAIESAHAGEYGKGFAVVAEEMRKLAEEASSNALQIKASVKDIKGHVSKSVNLGRSSEKTNDKLEEAVKDVEISFDEIASGITEISLGSEEVTEALTVMSESSKDLDELNLDVRKVIKDLLIMVSNMEELMKEILGS